jgi:hypothetical protein
LPTVDVMGPMLTAFAKIMDVSPKMEPGLVRRLDEHYFRRIAAVEFAVKYDDGKDPRGLLLADVVLVGVSRTSKTPLSMYLAHKRIRAGQFAPGAGGGPAGGALLAAPKKIMGLTIKPEILNEIRQERSNPWALRPRPAMPAWRGSWRNWTIPINHEAGGLPRLRCIQQSRGRSGQQDPGLYKGGWALKWRKNWFILFEEGNAGMKELLGGKGANLAEMTRIGLPVPPGFTITTDACRTYFHGESHYPGS